MSKEDSTLSKVEKGQIDQYLSNYIDATDEKEKKHWEMECYSYFKFTGFKKDVIDYLKEQGADDLASELKRFVELYQKAPHEHEKAA